MSANGSLHTDRVMRAVMQYRNTPLPDLRLSPAQIIFNCQLRDFIPVLSYKYRPSQEWVLLQEDRERAMASRKSMNETRSARDLRSCSEPDRQTPNKVGQDRGYC